MLNIKLTGVNYKIINNNIIYNMSQDSTHNHITSSQLDKSDKFMKIINKKLLPIINKIFSTYDDEPTNFLHLCTFKIPIYK